MQFRVFHNRVAEKADSLSLLILNKKEILSALLETLVKFENVKIPILECLFSYVRDLKEECY